MLTHVFIVIMVLGIVLHVPTTTEDQPLNVHVKKDTSILELLNVQLVTVNVKLVKVLPIIVPLVNKPEFKVLNQLVLVLMINSLTLLVNVKLVTIDVPLVVIIWFVKLVLILELQLMNVHVHKDILKLKTKLYVKFVLLNVLNVKLLLNIVFFVLLTESNHLQNVHVNLVNLILMELVLIVTGDVKNVILLLPIVLLVLKIELMLQLVFVQMVLMKLKDKVYVHHVKNNVLNVLLLLITVLFVLQDMLVFQNVQFHHQKLNQLK